MLVDELVQKIRTNMWSVESDYETGTVQTMLSPSEVKMLEWLARNHPLDNDAVIIDAGSFLGGSTAALAAGLAANPAVISKSGRIHAYDMFLAPNSAYSQTLIGQRKVGTSVLDIFKANLAKSLALITIHMGDFAAAAAPDAPIGILFVDVAKSWDLNQHIVREFFPRMIPGQTIVIQQDHNDQSCAWVNVTMEYFAEYFDYLSDDSGSRVFLYTKQIPSVLLEMNMEALPTEEKIRLARSASVRSHNPTSAYLSLTSIAWLISERSFDEAFAFLNEIAQRQPWESEVPYVAIIENALRVIKKSGHDSYIKGYFKERSKLAPLLRLFS